MGIFYGYLEEFEMIDSERYFIRFDIVTNEDMTRLLDDSENVLEGVLEEVLPYHLEIYIKKNELKRFSAISERTVRVGQWYQIKLGEKSEIIAFQYLSLIDNEFEEKSVDEINFIDGRSEWGRKISKSISLDNIDDSDENALKDILDKIERPKLVTVYNVGQGGCNGVCDSFGRPLLYFDFGGGIGQNSFTYSKRHKFCFAKNPPIILSHWDKDHWISAKVDKNSLNTSWIVPRQKLGVSHLKLAIELYRRGNLHIWPKSLKYISFNGGLIIKNTGKSINDSGLSLLSRIKDLHCTFNTLLPGDSQYKHIPFVNKYNLNGLIATHHGGHYKHDKHIPFAYKPNKIVYSYGLNNTYNHPSKYSISKHNKVKWNKRLDTIKGNILLGPCNTAIIPTQYCGNRICTLQIKQN